MKITIPGAFVYVFSPVLSSVVSQVFQSFGLPSEFGACCVCRPLSSEQSPTLCHDACMPQPLVLTVNHKRKTMKNKSSLKHSSLTI